MLAEFIGFLLADKRCKYLESEAPGLNNEGWSLQKAVANKRPWRLCTANGILMRPRVPVPKIISLTDTYQISFGVLKTIAYENHDEDKAKTIELHGEFDSFAKFEFNLYLVSELLATGIPDTATMGPYADEDKNLPR
jgi:hypothetical protein